MTELDAETLLTTHLRDFGVSLRRQVQLGLKHVDLVVDWPEGHAEQAGLEAIEIKLHDWRRAARQAFLDRAYVDRVSIAMPARTGRRVDFEYLAELGVGFIEFDEHGITRVLASRVSPAPASVSGAVRKVLARDA